MAEEEEYFPLKNLKIRLDQDASLDEESDFSLCFWLYLPISRPVSSVIISQIHHENEGVAPFLALNEQNKLCLFPLKFLHADSSQINSTVWMDIPHISTEMDCPREKWVHIACEVAANRMRFHVDGTLVKEKPLSIVSNYNQYQERLRKIGFVGTEGNIVKFQGYVYDCQVLPISASTKDHFIKNPPVKLMLRDSCISDGIEEGYDGTWSIVSGKESYRRTFSMEVVLLDAIGRIVHKELEIFASLVYADSKAPVEKTNDSNEAPLLTSCDGTEYPSNDKPITLLRGRATFKLKISLLSSKCSSKVFSVYFHTTAAQKYPFLEVYSRPIRCISKTKAIRLAIERKPVPISPNHCLNHSFNENQTCHIIHDPNGGSRPGASNISELKCTSSSKRLKPDSDKSLGAMDSNGVLRQDNTVIGRSVESKPSSPEGTIVNPSDSEITEYIQQLHTGISDLKIFKYCLDSISERTIVLKSLAIYSSNEDFMKFADQVSLYAGCTHHRYQIMMTKQLIQEGMNTWHSISGDSPSVLWNHAVPEINKRFMKISHSTTRSLSGKDLEVLREIAGCGEELSRENFDKLWYWLYPLALSLSKKRIHDLWECTKPLWIEGLIRNEEAENSLNGSRGLQRPGTFVLRFPTSRSWPHPDAGSLVVTYVGADYKLHHKLLSLDLSSENNGERNTKPLQIMLLEEPELSQLGRVIRHGTLC